MDHIGTERLGAPPEVDSPQRPSRIGLGCAWLYATPPNLDDVTELVRTAVRHGVTMFDTADSYGVSESLLGQACAGIRNQVFLASKGGFPFEQPSGTFQPNGRPEFLTASCEASLRRLNTDHLDLYYLHRRDPQVPLVESWGALAALVDSGKVRGIGVCEVDAATLAQLHAIHPVAAVQSELSIWTQDVLEHVLPWCAEHGAMFVAFAPLGRGYLSGAVTPATKFDTHDVRAHNPRFTPEARTANAKIVATIDMVARRIGATAAQTALAWVLAQDECVHAIPGTRNARRLVENAEAATVRLGPLEWQELKYIPSTVGGRY